MTGFPSHPRPPWLGAIVVAVDEVASSGAGGSLPLGTGAGTTTSRRGFGSWCEGDAARDAPGRGGHRHRRRGG